MILLDAPRMWEDAAVLLTYGLEEFENLRVFEKGQTVGTIGVAKGLSGVVPVVSAQDMWITISKSQRDAVEVDCAVYEGLEAPLPRWAPVGRVMVKVGAEVVAEAPLLAGKEVAPRTLSGMLKDFSHRLQKLLLAQ